MIFTLLVNFGVETFLYFYYFSTLIILQLWILIVLVNLHKPTKINVLNICGWLEL